MRFIFLILCSYLGFVSIFCGFLLDALLAVMRHFSPALLGYCSDSALLQVQRCGGVGERSARSHIVNYKTGDKHQQHHQHPLPREPLRANFHLQRLRKRSRGGNTSEH